MYKLFKGCLPQSLLSPSLKTLYQLCLCHGHYKQCNKNCLVESKLTEKIICFQLQSSLEHPLFSHYADTQTAISLVKTLGKSFEKLDIIGFIVSETYRILWIFYRSRSKTSSQSFMQKLFIQQFRNVQQKHQLRRINFSISFRQYCLLLCRCFLVTPKI